MIKVFYNGYGRVRLLGTGIVDNEVVEATANFYLLPEDAERFKQVGHANIYELLFENNDEGDYSVFCLTDATGNPSIIEITDSETKYTKDNDDGLKSGLRLYPDEEQANPEHSLNSTKNPPPATRHNVESKEDNSLLNVPEKKDAWFEVINEMTNEFYAEYGEIPTETQAWNRLNTQPPARYMTTVGIDRGENCLKMEGYKPLGKKSFEARWKKYTKQSPNHQA